MVTPSPPDHPCAAHMSACGTLHSSYSSRPTWPAKPL